MIWAPNWSFIILANILLGMNQGLAWSMTVNMKIDLAKPTERGLAVGINEFAGYIGVALLAYVSGYISSKYALRPEPYYVGVGVALIGIVLSLFVKDTGKYLKQQAKENVRKENVSLKEVFLKTTWKEKNLSSISLAGLTTNLKDGMAWGLFPLFFMGKGLSIGEIGVIVSIYPAAWGFFQLFSGIISDRIGRKWLISVGMWIQSLAIFLILIFNRYELWVIGALVLGIGTAMVYPTLQAAISDVTHPDWRASSLGIYRFRRDSGYAFGALIAGFISDVLNISWAIGVVACLPLLAGLITAIRMQEIIPKSKTNDPNYA